MVLIYITDTTKACEKCFYMHSTSFSTTQVQVPCISPGGPYRQFPKWWQGQSLRSNPPLQVDIETKSWMRYHGIVGWGVSEFQGQIRPRRRHWKRIRHSVPVEGSQIGVAIINKATRVRRLVRHPQADPTCHSTSTATVRDLNTQHIQERKTINTQNVRFYTVYILLGERRFNRIWSYREGLVMTVWLTKLETSLLCVHSTHLELSFNLLIVSGGEISMLSVHGALERHASTQWRWCFIILHWLESARNRVSDVNMSAGYMSPWSYHNYNTVGTPLINGRIVAVSKRQGNYWSQINSISNRTEYTTA